MLAIKRHTSSTMLVLLSFLASIWLRGSNALDCTSDLRKFDELLHKPKYRVVIDAIRGFDTTYREYNLTFAEYLTETAGRRFDPPIAFEMVPATFSGLFDAIDAEEADFIYSNPGSYSCIGVEQGAQPVATKVSHLEVRGHSYDLDVTGGVIFARSDNREIETVRDLRDKVIGAGGLSMFMAGQLQFNEMAKAGLSPVVDPKQVVLTGNQYDVVENVISGDFDVGFVRTDQLERMKDANGDPVDPRLFKIIHPQVHILDDGSLFPFLHSTEIYPEWPVAALTHVPHDVVEEVQDALLALSAHAASGKLIEACEKNGGLNCMDRLESFATRCDTKESIARLAYKASVVGKYKGFRTPRSYFGVRTIQEDTGFLWKSDDGKWQCTHDDSAYAGIHCPEGYFKLSERDFDRTCSKMGVVCKPGYQCFCKPCVATSEVEIFEQSSEEEIEEFAIDTDRTCHKMGLCGTVQQKDTILFRAIDHKKREGAKVEAIMHFGPDSIDLEVVPVNDVPFSYEISWSWGETGIGLLQVNIDGEQIPESPVRVQVVVRNCAIDFPGQGRTADESGVCSCGQGRVGISDRCVPSKYITMIVCAVGFLVLVYIGRLIVNYRSSKNDQLWHVDLDDLQFDDPVAVIGQGSFGVVLRAEYRGTTVAIKRAVKSKGKNRYGSAAVSTQEYSPEPVSELNVSETKPTASTSFPASSMSKKSGQAASNNRSSVDFSLGFLSRTRRRKRFFPWLLSSDNGRMKFNESILGESFSIAERRPCMYLLCPWMDANKKQHDAFISEMRVLSRLRHPNITTVMGAVIKKGHVPMLVMEYLEYGSLTEGLLQNETIHLNGEIILQIMRDMAQGLRYLHSSRPPILHGDLKGKNILIDSRFRAKLCDFGLSSKQERSVSGTPYWLPPEYLLGHTEYNASCDMYSVGIICYEIYSRKTPYEGENFCEVLRKVCNNRINKRPTIPPATPPRMVDVMKKCWHPDPFSRPQAKDLDSFMNEIQVRDVELVTKSETTKVRTADMMYEIFPKHIADDLQAGKKVEPESHELVTIVFSDIVKFTDISRAMSPLKVSNMLDRLYLSFDKLSRKHEVFKVETIGDAYMGVTNLMGNQEHNHVKLAAEFALDLINEAGKILIDEDAPEKGYLQVRVGFHSGPVVSNVIGSLNPRYGLFGDTVNTSNRMESNSKAGRVLCSEKSWNLLQQQGPEMPTTLRGKINVKGRGIMKVFWVGELEDTTDRSEDKDVTFLADLEMAIPSLAPQTPDSTRKTGRRMVLSLSPNKRSAFKGLRSLG